MRCFQKKSLPLSILKLKNTISLAVVFMLVTADSFAFERRPDFSGSWILKARQSLSGTDYADGLPEQMRISQNNYTHTITILTITPTEHGLDTGNYTLKLGGSPINTVSPSGKNKVIRFEYSADSMGMTETTMYSRPNESNPYRISKMYWRLAEGGSNIEIVREDKFGKVEENWSIKGLYGRSGAGIRFVEDENMQQVKAKAKAEGKFVFVDCYASWCGPCKKMDKDVYPLDDLGRFINDHFICIKMQMDTSRADDAEKKSRYADAHFLIEQYGINAYPTFLFFSPDGRIVHRDMGYKTADRICFSCGCRIESCPAILYAS
ncbi:thioredoxin family protein [Puia sp. P3]|uniref:thioredoxin family protein n=1 Tax=Puia sp. P3 TaxID=3423952 RepID=UPI003D667841